MKEKIKLELEYEINSSPKILYAYINEPKALAQWLADEVSVRENTYTFTWHDEEKTAKLIGTRDNKSVKFKWIDDEPYYLELEILQDELTNDVALLITDFTYEENLPDRRLVWDNSIDYLLSVLGA